MRVRIPSVTLMRTKYAGWSTEKLKAEIPKLKKKAREASTELDAQAAKADLRIIASILNKRI